MSVVSKLKINTFNIPIHYSENIKNTDQNLVSELELVSSKTEMSSVYKNLFNPKTKYGEIVSKEYAKYYTTDKSFIKETQELYKIYKPTLKKETIDNFNNSIDDIKSDTNFLKTYQYLDIKQLQFLNKNELFLQLYSIYNIASPAVSLVYPIIIFIIPFFLLKLKYKDLPLSAYKKLLYRQFVNSSFGKLRFVVDNEVDAFKKLYVLVTLGLYVYGIYQNINSCIRFISNIKKINNIFTNCKNYFNYVSQEYKTIKEKCKHLKCYSKFVNSFDGHISNIKNLTMNISKLNVSLKNPASIGSGLLILHKLKYNDIINDSLTFFNGFIGYIDIHLGLLDNKNINPISFTSKSTTFKESFHPLVKNEEIIKNDINLKNNIILSGPNASGKTTIIKGVCINVLLSQQIGFGYFKSGKINVYDNINCYLNINDNNDKDSLFQAEARRCKEILDNMKKNKKERYFCIFDELYSGTNPDDAVNAAYMYLTYISKMKCNFIITTHYNELCNKFIENGKIKNKNMIDYSIKEGITKKTNGINILTNLDYPEEMLNIV